MVHLYNRCYFYLIQKKATKQHILWLFTLAQDWALNAAPAIVFFFQNINIPLQLQPQMQLLQFQKITLLVSSFSWLALLFPLDVPLVLVFPEPFDHLSPWVDPQELSSPGSIPSGPWFCPESTFLLDLRLFPPPRSRKSPLESIHSLIKSWYSPLLFSWYSLTSLQCNISPQISMHSH